MGDRLPTMDNLSPDVIKALSGLFVDLYARVFSLQSVVAIDEQTREKVEAEYREIRVGLERLPTIVELAKHPDTQQLVAVVRTLRAIKP